MSQRRAINKVWPQLEVWIVNKAFTLLEAWGNVTHVDDA